MSANNSPTEDFDLFTDEHLRRLRDESTICDSLQVSRVPGLVARLDAAERVVKAHSDLEAEKISYDTFVGLLNRWRKVAGKAD